MFYQLSWPSKPHGHPLRSLSSCTSYTPWNASCFKWAQCHKLSVRAITTEWSRYISTHCYTLTEPDCAPQSFQWPWDHEQVSWSSWNSVFSFLNWGLLEHLPHWKSWSLCTVTYLYKHKHAWCRMNDMVEAFSGGWSTDVLNSCWLLLVVKDSCSLCCLSSDTGAAQRGERISQMDYLNHSLYSSGDLPWPAVTMRVCFWKIIHEYHCCFVIFFW